MDFVIGVEIAIFGLMLIELSSFLWTRVFPIDPSVEFKKMDDSVLNRFVTFDAELGHAPVPNTKKVDRDITGKHYEVVCTYDEIASRISQLDGSVDVMGAAFGDSFCQCRGVQDNETWQAYLEARFGQRFLNFGVGGYGLDQAYLRYLRVRDRNLGKTIVYAISPCTIERIVGVYKHYIEFGNYLGVKPRFVVAEGRLHRMPIPVQSKNDLRNLAKRKSQIRAMDDNYSGYFSKYYPAFPFSFFVARNWRQYLISLIAVVAESRFWRSRGAVVQSLSALKERLVSKRKNEAYRRKNLYFKKLFAEKESFFVSIVRECKIACEADGRSMYFAFLPDYTNISHMREEGHYYRKVIDRVRSELGISVFDSYEIFRDASPREIFLKDNYSGHHTAHGNACVAAGLVDLLGVGVGAQETKQ